MKRSIVQQTEHTIIDKNGEVQSNTKSTVLKVEAEPSYIKIYLQDILYLNNLQSNQTGLLYELLSYLNYDNEIVLNSTIKRRIAEKLETTIQVIDNNLSKLVKKDILKRVGRGVYIANPYLFGKGKWKDILEKRIEHISLKIEYSKEGVSYSSSLNKG